MKIYVEIILLIIAVVIIGYIFFHYAEVLFAPVTQQNIDNKVCFNGKCFIAIFTMKSKIFISYSKIGFNTVWASYIFTPSDIFKIFDN